MEREEIIKALRYCNGDTECKECSLQGRNENER